MLCGIKTSPYVCAIKQRNMARVQPITSKLAYEKIVATGAREGHYKKIITGIKIIGTGTAWEIASACELKPDQCWKRISELVKSEILIDTGLRRNSPDGNLAMVYALFTDADKYKDVPKVERQEKITAVDWANKLIASSGRKLVQKDLF